MGWLKDWRRKRLLERHHLDDETWDRAVGRLQFIGKLPPEETKKLKQLVILFLAEKQFSGAHGVEVTDRMRVAIAAQACLPILELGIDWYAGWTGVVLYPGDFRVRRSELDEDGVLHEWDDELAGEAMPGGPVVLSWDAAAHDVAINVVIHEFAHKLDMLSGEPNGAPPLHPNMNKKKWSSTLDTAYEGFCDAVERGKDTWLDPYAAEHRSEFFAVLSEAFFTDPRETKRRYPDLYDQFALFYRQDPASRLQH
jgi:Mlc titration factor MtfA (ptsG expression regulator)